jgi:hypothetical protein
MLAARAGNARAQSDQRPAPMAANRLARSSLVPVEKTLVWSPVKLESPPQLV